MHLRVLSGGCDSFIIMSAAYPAVYGQFPQAIPQPMSAVPPAQREGKDISHYFVIITIIPTQVYIVGEHHCKCKQNSIPLKLFCH